MNERTIHLPAVYTSNRRSARGPRAAGGKTAQSPAPLAGRTKHNGTASISSDGRQSMVAQAAYFRAERRGFEPGHEVEDWLAAEREVDDLLQQAELPA
jgi:Protein of unknown function (DUF2934)